MVKSACWVCPSRRAWFLPKSKGLGPLGAVWPSALAAGCRVCGNPTTVVGKGGRHPRVASQRAHALLTTHGDLDEVGVEVRRPLWAWSGASRTSSPVRCLLLRTRAALARHMQRTPRPACSPQSPWCPQRPWPGVAHEVAVSLPARARAPHKCRGAACTSRPLPPRMQPAILPPCLSLPLRGGCGNV